MEEIPESNASGQRTPQSNLKKDDSINKQIEECVTPKKMGNKITPINEEDNDPSKVVYSNESDQKLKTVRLEDTNPKHYTVKNDLHLENSSQENSFRQNKSSNQIELQNDVKPTTNKIAPKDDEKDPEQIKPKVVSYLSLFKYGTKRVRIWVFFGLSFAFLHGSALGTMPIILGDSIKTLSDDCGDDCSLTDTVAKVSLLSVYIGLGAATMGTCSKFVWTYVSKKIEVQSKSLYFRKILLNDIAWYDTKSPEKITAEYNIDSEAYVNATGFSNAQVAYTIGLILSSFVVG